MIRTKLSGDDGRSDHQLKQLVEDERQESDEWTGLGGHEFIDRSLEFCLKLGLPDTRRYLVLLGGVHHLQKVVQLLVLSNNKS